MDLINKYYSQPGYQPSDAILQRQQYLFYIRGVKFNRYYLFPAAFLIQICVGSFYAFSGLTLPIEQFIYGPNGNIDRSIAANVFYVCIGVFGITAAIGGPILERYGPFVGSIVGSVFFFIGNLLSGLGVYLKAIEVVFVGYGLFCGIGIGFAYVAPVSALQKWFPEARGFSAGIAVGGVAVGTIIAPFTQNWFIDRFGVAMMFVILGCIYFAVMAVFSLVMRMPPPGYSVKGVTIQTIRGTESLSKTAIVTTNKEMGSVEIEEATIEENPSEVIIRNNLSFTMTMMEAIASMDYRLMWLMFLGSQITGILIVSKIQPICINQFETNKTTAAFINSLIGVANVIGRVVIPMISDLLPRLTGNVVGRKSIFLLSLVVQLVTVALLPTSITTQNFPAFLAFVGAWYAKKKKEKKQYNTL